MKANLSLLEKVISVVIVLAVAALLLALPWLVWVNVLPYFWPDGPEQFINPPYLMFLGGWMLIAMVGRAILPRK